MEPTEPLGAAEMKQQLILAAVEFQIQNPR